jgi:hypothetical protein
MPRTITYLLGGPALGCLLAGSAPAQDPAPAAQTSAVSPAPATPAFAAAASAAETTATPDSSLVVIRFNPYRDVAAQRSADSMGLTPDQRAVYFKNYAVAVGQMLQTHPSAGRVEIDSVRSELVRDTGRKVRFVRQARRLFADMYARRARDKARAPGTEEELWRSSKNVASLIALYRENPEATDTDLERAMAPSFDR